MQIKKNIIIIKLESCRLESAQLPGVIFADKVKTVMSLFLKFNNIK